MDWQYLNGDEHFSTWWSIKKKIRIEILIYCLYCQLNKRLEAILSALKVSDKVGSYTFSGKIFEDFVRIFQEPTLIYMNLASTTQNVCVESYVLGINTCTCRNARQQELEKMCKHHSALVVAQWICTRVTRGHWEQKMSVFTHFESILQFSVFTHFVSILQILYSVYLNICFHWPSSTLKLINVIFSTLFIKNQELSRTKNQFQVHSRPWNQTLEI